MTNIQGTAASSDRPVELQDPAVFANGLKDLYGTLLATRNLEIGLFWQRSNYFLVLNSALALGFFNLKEAKYAAIFAVMGFLASTLWFWVCLGGKYWQARWEQRLMDFENEHLPDLAFFAADPKRIQEDVRRSLEFHPLSRSKKAIYGAVLRFRPSVSFSMIMLSAMFTIGWLAACAVFLLL